MTGKTATPAGRRTALIAFALVVAFGWLPAGEGEAAGDRITLSAEVDRLTVRPCLPEQVRLGITNHSSRAHFVDVTITAEHPLQPSKPGLSTYVPAGATVYTNVGISAAVDAEPGTGEVVFSTGRSERLVVPATVLNPPEARCLPRESMTATATSAQVSPDYGPRFAIDGNNGTFWHSRYSPVRDPLPQSIVLDLGGSYDVAELVYQPRTSGSMNGTITGYVVHGSSDGQTFTKLAEGTWAADRTRKTVGVGGTGLRYLELEALAGYGGYAGAAEIVLYGS